MPLSGALRISAIFPIHIALFIPFLVIGFIFLLVGRIGDLDLINDPVFHMRQVGFAAAPNWSLYLTLIYPFQISIFVYVLFEAHRFLRELRSTRLLVKSTGDFTESDEVEAIWAFLRLITLLSFFIFLAIFELNYYYEWYRYSYRWIYDPSFPTFWVPDQVERDWSVGSQITSMEKHPINQTFNVIFSLMAHLYVGVGWAVMFSFFTFTTLFATGLWALSSGAREYITIPDFRRSREFFGYRGLEPIISATIWFAGLSLLFFLAMRMQNVYLWDEKLNSIADLFLPTFQTSLKGIENMDVKRYILAGNIKSIWSILFSAVVVCFVWANLILYNLLFLNLRTAGSTVIQRLANEGVPENAKWYAEIAESFRARRAPIEREIAVLPFSMRTTFEPKKLIGWSLLSIVSVVWIDLGIFYLISLGAAVIRKIIRWKEKLNVVS